MRLPEPKAETVWRLEVKHLQEDLSANLVQVQFVRKHKELPKLRWDVCVYQGISRQTVSDGTIWERLPKISIRKSSCVNARGHTARRAASPWWWYLPWLGGTHLCWGGTYLGQGVAISAGGYLPWQGVAISAGGVPTLARSTHLGQGGYPPWPGSPLGVNRQKPVKTLPSPSFGCGR